MNKPNHPFRLAQSRAVERKNLALISSLPLILILVAVAACGVHPVAADLRVVEATLDPESGSSPAPPASSSPSSLTQATLASLPTVPAARTSHPPDRTISFRGAGPTPVPSTSTAAATEMATAPPTRTHTVTPQPTVSRPSTSTPPPGGATESSVQATAGPAFSAALTTSSAITFTGFIPTRVASPALDPDIVHILLIGGDTDYPLDMNTDTLVVLIVNRKTKQVSLFSIPRDLWVYIPTYGWDRINTAHRIGARFKYPDGGGPGLLMRTIKENIGIPIDHWVRIGYDGFERAVDELGGIDMIVPCAVNLSYRAGQEARILEPGVHHLDGATALRYVRTRRGDSDWERTGRQQQFLKTVWNQFKTPEFIPKIPGLWLALKGGFKSDLSLGDALALAPVALDLQPGQIRSRSIGRGQVTSWTTPKGAAVQIPIPERVQAVVASLYAPQASGEGQDKGGAARIEVRNGTGLASLGLIAADRLRWEGIKVADTGPAERSNFKRTQIIVYSDIPETVEKLAVVLNVRSDEVSWQLDPNQPADIRVILGSDYDPCH